MRNMHRCSCLAHWPPSHHRSCLLSSLWLRFPWKSLCPTAASTGMDVQGRKDVLNALLTTLRAGPLPSSTETPTKQCHAWEALSCEALQKAAAGQHEPWQTHRGLSSRPDPRLGPWTRMQGLALVFRHQTEVFLTLSCPKPKAKWFPDTGLTAKSFQPSPLCNYLTLWRFTTTQVKHTGERLNQGLGEKPP